MDNWLNTRAGMDFSMRTIPDMTKAMNRLADALLVQNDLKIDKRQPKWVISERTSFGADEVAYAVMWEGKEDDNEGLIYGIEYMDGEEVSDVEWFATAKERDAELKSSETQSEPTLEDIVESGVIDKAGLSEALGDWEDDAKLLYTALSRMHQADNEDMEIATEMAFEVLSSVSMDFRNEYAACKWPTLEDIVAEEHMDKRWYTDCTWATERHDLLGDLVLPRGQGQVEEEELIEVIRQLWPQGETMANEEEPSTLVEMRDALAKDGEDIETILSYHEDSFHGVVRDEKTGEYSYDKGIGKARAISSGEFYPIGLHHDGADGWNALLDMEVGEFFWTHEPFNGENLWYRVR